MDPDLSSIQELCERVAHPPSTSKVRRYQFRNVKDLRFDSIKESTVEGQAEASQQPSVLPYFIQNGRYRATAVLEESVIDNECIKQTAFLRQFDPEFVDEVMAEEGCVRAIVFLPNQVIVREGEKGDSMMVIAKGEVEVSVQGVPIKRLGEGSFFGELVFVGATDQRTATITAVTFCDVRQLYRKAFVSVIKKYPDVEERFKHAMATRMDVVQKDVSRIVKSAAGWRRTSTQQPGSHHGGHSESPRGYTSRRSSQQRDSAGRSHARDSQEEHKLASYSKQLDRLKQFKKEYRTTQVFGETKKKPE